MLKTLLSPTPNLHDYAHWIRPAIKPSYQPKKVWTIPTWVETSFEALRPSGLRLYEALYKCEKIVKYKSQSIFFSRNYDFRLIKVARMFNQIALKYY